jgi:polar amino acid transport system substrate-binding protein
MCKPSFVKAVGAIGLLMLATLQPTFAASTLDVVKGRGKVLLGVKTDYPPFAYLDAQQRYQGFDVELWQEFAKDLGVTIEFVPITSQTRIPTLLSGAIDVVSGGTTHTIARDKSIDYSVTYFVTGQRLLVRKGRGIKDPADLAAPRITAAVQGANSGANFMKIQPQGKLTSFQEYPQAVLALKQGKVDALTSDDVLLAQFATEQPDLEVVGGFMTREYYGMLMREDDSKWRDWINFSIQAAWKNGTYLRLYHKYFGPAEPPFELEIWQD